MDKYDMIYKKSFEVYEETSSLGHSKLKKATTDDTSEHTTKEK